MKKLLIICVLMAGVIAGLGGMVQPVWADGVCEEGAPPEVLEAAGCNASQTVQGAAHGLIEVALGIMPVIAVGVMIYGGITYLTSQGDSGKTTKARNIIIYGVVGLIVSLIAYVIVKFVLENVLGMS